VTLAQEGPVENAGSRHWRRLRERRRRREIGAVAATARRC
jgi:hypothetical protein